MKLSDRLKRLEQRQPATRPPLILTIGLDDDGLYHGPHGATYDEAAANELTKEYTVIVLEYGDWPPDGHRRVGTTMVHLGDVDFERI